MHDTFAFAFRKLVGKSAWTRRTRRRILQISNYSYPVLITGPSGSGRELVARAIHAHSARADQPFVPFRCSFVPESLCASQLFGQAQDASELIPSATLGCFGVADGGTLYLEEVADLDFATQAQLLVALEEKRIVPFGASEARTADVRLICSSSRDLDREVDQGRFSFELLYRLNMLPVSVLPLDQRVEDIEPLVRHVIARVTLENGLPFKQLTPSAMALLQAYHWPGNVDQLCEVVERAVVFTNELRLGPDAFPDVIEACDDRPAEAPIPEAEAVNDHESIPGVPVVDGRWPTLDDLEAEHIRETLIEARYNQAAAARMLAIPLATLMEKIRKHRIPLPRFRQEAGSQQD